jgi:hypothetical protein
MENSTDHLLVKDQSLWIVSLILMEQIVSECSRTINKENKFAHISTIKKFHINPQVHASLLWVAVHKKMDRCFSCIEITCRCDRCDQHSQQTLNYSVNLSVRRILRVSRCLLSVFRYLLEISLFVLKIS